MLEITNSKTVPVCGTSTVEDDGSKLVDQGIDEKTGKPRAGVWNQ